MAEPGQKVYPTVAQARGIGVFVEGPSRISGLDYDDPDMQRELITSNVMHMTLTPASLRENNCVDKDVALIWRVPGVDQASCDRDANVDYAMVNLAHRNNVSIYGPNDAHDHEDWAGSGDVGAPNAAGEFAVTGEGSLKLNIACGYEDRLNDIPSQCFPVGMPGAPTMYWIRKADAWRAFDGLPRADNGQPYSVPKEGVWCWLGWPFVKFELEAPGSCSLLVSLVVRRYRHFDNHVTDSTRQTDYAWAPFADEFYDYRLLNLQAGSNTVYLCLPAPCNAVAPPTPWSPIGTYEYGRIDTYEGTDCSGECDEFAQRLWEEKFGAVFLAGWWKALTEHMLEYKPDGSEWVEAQEGYTPSPGDIVFVSWYDGEEPLETSHVYIMHEDLGVDGWAIVESNATGLNVGWFSRVKDGINTDQNWIRFRGAGSAEWNGWYRKERYDTYGGKALYKKNSTHHYWYNTTEHRWILSPTPGDSAPNWAYMGPVNEDPEQGPWIAITGQEFPPTLFKARGQVIGWLHWLEGMRAPATPAPERVVSVEMSGFCNGDWVLEDAPRMSLDPLLQVDEQIGVKAFEGYEYQKGGLSAAVGCAHIMAMHCGDDWNRNFAELTLPFFDRVIGATTGADLTTAFSLEAIIGLMEDCFDAWEASLNGTERDRATLDDLLVRLSELWGFDICAPEGTHAFSPLEQDGHVALNAALRCGTWELERGIVYTLRNDTTMGGMARGIDLSEIGVLAREREAVGQIWRRIPPWGSWQPYGSAINSGRTGLWPSVSLPEVNRYFEHEGVLFPEFFEYAVTAYGATSVASEQKLGRAPVREYVSGWIVAGELILDWRRNYPYPGYALDGSWLYRFASRALGATMAHECTDDDGQTWKAQKDQGLPDGDTVEGAFRWSPYNVGTQLVPHQGDGRKWVPRRDGTL